MSSFYTLCNSLGCNFIFQNIFNHQSAILVNSIYLVSKKNSHNLMETWMLQLINCYFCPNLPCCAELSITYLPRVTNGEYGKISESDQTNFECLYKTCHNFETKGPNCTEILLKLNIWSLII